GGAAPLVRGGGGGASGRREPPQPGGQREGRWSGAFGGAPTPVARGGRPRPAHAAAAGPLPPRGAGGGGPAVGAGLAARDPGRTGPRGWPSGWWGWRIGPRPSPIWWGTGGSWAAVFGASSWPSAGRERDGGSSPSGPWTPPAWRIW